MVNLEVGLPDIETILGEPPVVNDHEAIGRLAAEHLIDRGFRTFGYFGLQGQRWSDLRCLGFRDAVGARGCPCEEYRGRRKPTRGYRLRLGEREMDDAARWIQGLPKPVGLLAGYDHLAVQLLEACGRAGPSRHRWLFGDRKPPLKPPLHEQFVTGGTHLRRTRPTRGWLRRSQQVDVDHRQLVGRRLNRVAFVMGLHEFASVGGRPPGG